MQETPDPAETYLEALIAGDAARLLSGFGGEPLIDDPLGGHVLGLAALERLTQVRQVWLAQPSGPCRATAHNAQP
jgi:hypothetical protein